MISVSKNWLTDRATECHWLQKTATVSRSQYIAADLWHRERHRVSPHSHHNPFTLPVSSPTYVPFCQEWEVAWDSTSSQTWWHFHLLQDKTSREYMWWNQSPGSKGIVENISQDRISPLCDSLRWGGPLVFTFWHPGDAALHESYKLLIVYTRMPMAAFWGLDGRWLALSCSSHAKRIN